MVSRERDDGILSPAAVGRRDRGIFRNRVWTQSAGDSPRSPRGPVEGRRPETRTLSDDGIIMTRLPKKEGRSPEGENQGRTVQVLALVLSAVRLMVELLR